MKKNNDFDFENLPIEARDPEISQEDFTLQQADKEIHEQKFQTKPTTFLKDSLKRFSKNKSSVVAAYILGILILLSIFVPIFDKNDVSNTAPDSAYFYLEPKLFDNTNGFWDGTVKKTNVPVDTSSHDQKDWWPNLNTYKIDGISNYHIDGTRFTSDINEYARGGYAKIGYYGGNGLTTATMSSMSSFVLEHRAVLNLATTSLTLKTFETVDADKIKAYYDIAKADDPYLPALPSDVMPQNFTIGLASLEFVYVSDDTGLEVTIPLTEKKAIHNTGSALDVTGKDPINIGQVIMDYIDDPSHGLAHQDIFSKFYFQIRVDGPEGTPADESVCSLIRAIELDCGDTASNALKVYIKGGIIPEDIGGQTIDVNYSGISFARSNDFLIRESKFKVAGKEFKNSGYWTVESSTKMCKTAHLAVCTYASFTYDSYRGQFGRRENISIYEFEFEIYADKGYIDYFIEPLDSDPTRADPSSFYFEILDKENSPIMEDITANDVYFETSSDMFVANCTVRYYRYLGLDKMPKFLFGTDKTGRDMFKYVFDGLKTSLLIGLATFAICFTFGLIYGAISGYFGGTVDLVMERITDVLSGIPFIVLMTLIILKAGQNYLTFGIALCMTGWIGTASTTRTQFYRFRGREYVLASRTLGASDARLIAKHILPNALGTIITGAVLMIPSVIFSEATISYLGLGFKNASSLGVILSDNQIELLSHPYLLLFPSAVIALIMISFNLFGNGLRDAINPSLKGEGE